MEKNPTYRPDPCYRIQVRGHLGPELQEWFYGLCITSLPSGITELCGTFRDQAALFGILLSLRDLGLPLLLVQYLSSEGENHE
jgi:hypothetical protein